jgi:hypothetical protein
MKTLKEEIFLVKLESAAVLLGYIPDDSRQTVVDFRRPYLARIEVLKKMYGDE